MATEQKSEIGNRKSASTVIALILVACIAAMIAQIQSLEYQLKLENQANTDLKGTMDWMLKTHAEAMNRYAPKAPRPANDVITNFTIGINHR